MSGVSRYTWALAGLALLVLAAAWTVWFPVYKGVYEYDEADYRYAASQGFLSNWIDSPGMPFSEFVELGMRARSGAKRGELAAESRDSGDIHSYRHWHGPLYFWFLAPWPERNEALNRESTYALILLTAALGATGGWILFRSPLIAFLGGAFLLTSTTLWGTRQLAPHILFEASALAALIAVAHAAQTSEKRSWWISIALTAVTFCVMELSFALVLTVLLTSWIYRRELHLTWRDLARAVLLFAATVTVLWPGTWLKLSFVKSYAFMSYLALARQNAWGQLTVLDAWAVRIKSNPVEFLILAAGVVLLFRLSRTQRVAVFPLWIFVLIMVAATFKVNGEGPRYLIPYLPVALAASAWTLGAVVQSSRFALLLPLIFLGTGVFQTHTQLAAGQQPPEQWKSGMVRLLEQNGYQGKRLLVPAVAVPTVHFYLKGTLVHGYTDAADAQALLKRNSYDAWVEGDPARIEPLR
jgi:hypothetical protein